MATDPRRRRRSPLAAFLRTEASGGALLVFATAVALAWANSPWSGSYERLWHTTLSLGSGDWAVRETLHHWVNDALMALFFFLAGLEIKRELRTGSLRDPRTAALPLLAALGGMLVPAVIFLATAGDGATRGWAIPVATDIAFAVGVLTLLGPRVPVGLKVFLLTLAVADDVGGIIVIAFFYADGLRVAWLAGAIGPLAAIGVARRLGLSRPLAYLPLGAIAWYAAYRAGVHPTIAAVAVALITPAGPVRGRPVLEELEYRLHPWSSYLVLPVFALANAGVHLGGGAIGDAATSRVTWAVAAALVAGKIVGISGAAWLSVRAGLTRLPVGVPFGHIVGAGGLGGIGFTVSLLVTDLAFDAPVLQTQAKTGILAGSLVAALLGAAILRRRLGPGVLVD